MRKYVKKGKDKTKASSGHGTSESSLKGGKKGRSKPPTIHIVKKVEINLKSFLKSIIKST